MLALRFNPEVQNAEIDRVVQKFNLKLAFREFEWQYTLNGSASYNRIKTNPFHNSVVRNYSLVASGSRKFSTGTHTNVRWENNSDGSSYDPKLTLELEQPFLRGAGRTIATSQLNDAVDDEDINVLSLQQNVINAIRQIIADYRNLILKNSNVKTSSSALKDAQKLYQSNKAQIEAGRLPETVNVQHAAQVENLKLALERSKDEQRRSRFQLLQDLGLDPNMNITVPDNVKLDNIMIPKLKETLDYALAHNINYQKLLIAHKKSLRALLVAQDQLRPELNLKGAVTLGNGINSAQSVGPNKLLHNWDHSESAALTLNIPIDTLPQKAQIASSQVQIEKDKIEIARQRRMLTIEINNQIRDIVSQIKQIRISKKFVRLAKKNYELEILKQKVGRASSIDVTNSQNSLIQAQSDLIANKINYLESVSNLKATLATTLDEWNIKIRA